MITYIWIFCLVSILGQISAESRRHPVIYIPGDGGNQLEARYQNPQSSTPNCGLTSKWRRLWLDVYQLTSNSKVKCWASNIKLNYDFKEGKNKNVKGVETRVPGWGDTDSVEYIDDSWLAWVVGDVGNVAATLVRHMTSKWGYKRGLDVRAAPYDFRFAPNSQTEFFLKLKALIEETVERTGERVVLLTHSLGGVFGLQFLTRIVDSEWKRRFIHAFVPMGTPWAGSAVAFNLYVAGDSRGIKSVDPKLIREDQRSYETGTLLLPSVNLWTPSNFVFASTPTRNFTTANYDQFFADLNYPVGKINHDHVKNSTQDVPIPGVSAYCIYSRGIPTALKFVYTDSGFTSGDQPIQKILGDGDGTVNLESLQQCRRWLRKMSTRGSGDDHRRSATKKEVDGDEGVKVETRMFDGITHGDLMKNDEIFAYLEKIFIEK